MYLCCREETANAGRQPLGDKCKFTGAWRLVWSSQILGKISNWLHSRAMDLSVADSASRSLLIQFLSVFTSDVMEDHPRCLTKLGNGTEKNKNWGRLLFSKTC